MRCDDSTEISPYASVACIHDSTMSAIVDAAVMLYRAVHGIVPHGQGTTRAWCDGDVVHVVCAFFEDSEEVSVTRLRRNVYVATTTDGDGVVTTSAEAASPYAAVAELVAASLQTDHEAFVASSRYTAT